MIHPDLAGNPTAAERWAFELLVDLARLLPAAEPEGATVQARLGERGTQDDFGIAPGRVRISPSVLQQVVDVAGAGIEQRTRTWDRHGRVPASANPVVGAGVDRAPPMHALAERFAQAVQAAAGDQPVWRVGPWPGTRAWAAAITHDLDIVSGWPFFAGLRTIELLKKGKVGRAVSAVSSSVAALARDPVRQSLERILEIEGDAGIHSTWFVLSGEPSLAGWRRGDITYALEGSKATSLVQRILSGGHEIGLHGSFDTRDDPALMAAERERVAQVTGTSPRGIRQHFLRLDPARTLLHAEAAGFTYDATLGFADRNGFRLGVADVTTLWNETQARALRLVEAPLAWMDRTHSKYRGEEEPTLWVQDALALADQARALGGLWVGLWHPNVSAPLGFPGALEAFSSLVQQLKKREPWLASLGEIVEWRAARRGLRGRRRPQGGAVELVSSRPGRWEVKLIAPNGTGNLHPWPSHG